MDEQNKNVYILELHIIIGKIIDLCNMIQEQIILIL